MSEQPPADAVTAEDDDEEFEDDDDFEELEPDLKGLVEYSLSMTRLARSSNDCTSGLAGTSPSPGQSKNTLSQASGRRLATGCQKSPAPEAPGKNKTRRWAATEARSYQAFVPHAPSATVAPVIAFRLGEHTFGGKQVPDEQKSVNTGGGGYFAGTVSAGGDVIGRDKVVLGNEGVSGAELAQLFQPVYACIGQTARGSDADRLTETVQGIQHEAAKADAADSERIKGWLATLAEMAPDVLETVVTALTNPGAAVAGAVRIVAEQFQARAP